ncbi:MAG: hypothetical protein L3J03_04480 [Desulfobacterales bacterium]|nr:hypothetical protein [Desulfobacterales bacterium]
MEETLPPIISEQLANGITIDIYDLSRRVAGDRWQVTLRCDAAIQLNNELWQKAPKEPEPGLAEEIRSALGNELLLSLEQERNFIDAALKDRLIKEMIGRVRANIFAYLNNSRFPERLLARRYQETREQLLRDRMIRAVTSDPDDDDGPADFSYLFADDRRQETGDG